MTSLPRIACIAALALCSSTASSAEVASSPDSPRCQVWQRELGFAKSVVEDLGVAFRIARVVRPTAVAMLRGLD